MGIIVFSLLWAMQDLYHQPYQLRIVDFWRYLHAELPIHSAMSSLSSLMSYVVSRSNYVYNSACFA